MTYLPILTYVINWEDVVWQSIQEIKFKLNLIQLTPNLKNIIISISIRTQNNNLFDIHLVYRSPNSPNSNNLELLNIFENISSNSQNSTIIIGDFNLKQINWETLNVPTRSDNQDCKFEERFIDKVLDSFYTQHVHEPTRYRDGQQSNILDLVFTDPDLTVYSIDHLPPLGRSDHCILSILTNISKTLQIQELNYC